MLPIRTLSLLLRCPLCGDSLDFESAPFCKFCSEVNAEPVALCGGCLLPHGGSPCPSTIQSIYALHLSVGSTHQKIRAWKKRKSPLWDRHLLNPKGLSSTHCPPQFLNPLAWLIPIPQNPKRSTELGGNPALTIARWVSAHTKMKIEDRLFELPQAKIESQAKKDRWQRWVDTTDQPKLRSDAWKHLKTNKTKHALLVDDFCTTGATLRAHAEPLLELGFDRVDALVLGYRPKGLSLSQNTRTPIGELHLQ